MTQAVVQRGNYLGESDTQHQAPHLDTAGRNGNKSFTVTKTKTSVKADKPVTVSALKKFVSETDLTSVGFDCKKRLSILDEYLFWDVEEHFKQQFYLFNEQAKKLPHMSFKELQSTKYTLLQKQLKEVKTDRIEFANEVSNSLLTVRRKVPIALLRGIEVYPQTFSGRIVLPEAISALKEEFEADIELINRATYNGEFTFELSNINDTLAEIRPGSSGTFYSPHFYTSEKEGYKFWLRVMLNGDSNEGIRGKYCSVFISLLPHIYDDVVEWPIKPVVTFSLLNQFNGKSIIRKVDYRRCQPGLTKPPGSFNRWSLDDCEWKGVKKFAEISELSNTAFQKNGSLFFKCEIQFP